MAAKPKYFDYKVIYHQAINANGVKREVGEIFSEEDTKEMKTLCAHKYIKKVEG